LLKLEQIINFLTDLDELLLPLFVGYDLLDVPFYYLFGGRVPWKRKL